VPVIPGPIAGNTSTTAVISPTVTNTYKSVLNYSGDSDWWRISVTAGLTYDFTLTGDGGADTLDDGRLHLRDNLGNIITSVYEGTTVSLTSATNGIYYVDVTDGYLNDNLREGTYVLTARTNDTVVNNRTTQVNLTHGDRAGMLGQSNDADWYKVTMVAGRTYDFQATGDGSANSLDDLALAIRDADGNVINNTSGKGVWISHTATVTGTYYVSVADGYRNDNAAEGGFILSSRLNDTVVNNDTTAAVIGGSGQVWGSLGQSYDSDWYRVSLREGFSYGFTLQGDGSVQSLDDGIIRIRSADGTSLDSANEGFTASLAAGMTGIYYVEVADGYLNDNLAEGNFRIRAAMSDTVRNDNQTAGAMIDGQRIGGVLDVYTDADWYGFNAVQGRTYQIRMSGNGAANDLQYQQVRVIGSNGQQLASDANSQEDGVAIATFTASTTGRVYLSAEGYSFETSSLRTTGGFFLQVISDAPVVNGTAAANHLTGGDVDNRIYGLAGNDSLFGAVGNDKLFGGNGADRLDGGAGDDSLQGGAGNDTMFGGAGLDTADYAGSRAVTVNLALAGLQATGWGSDLLNGIENVSGGSRGDRLTGNAGANHLIGAGGNDTLRGAAGADSLTGGAGNDLLVGGLGKDTAVYAGGAATVDLRLTGAQATGHGMDTLREIENLQGGNGRDRLFGNGVANLLSGGANDDTLSGYGGRDVLRGGTGDDVLYGGSRADRFVFALGDDVDRVRDFQNNVDTLVFEGTGYFFDSQLMSHARQSGSNVIFDFGSGDRLIVLNTTVAAVADDILLV
jgi:Ca2+-binding RTX toxin-like protein